MADTIQPCRGAYLNPMRIVSDIALRDGSTVHVRAVGPSDVEPLAAFLDGLSAQARWFRFLGGGVDAGRAARALVESGVGLLATAGPGGAIVAHACYVPEAADRAEVAFAVGDAWQGRGIATLLLGQLAELADAAGYATLTATVHPTNHRMLQVFRDSGFAIEVSSEPGELHVRMPSRLGPGAHERFEERDRVGAVAAVRHVLEPASVAVVGASRRRDRVGGAVLRNLLEAGFSGPVYAVNHHARRVAGLPAYASLHDVPGPVELAVIAVAAPSVLAVARDCAAHGVRALVVLSAGFAETGSEGGQRQDELLRICRDAGMRLVGPNCLGVLNTDPGVRLDATFAPSGPPAGRIAFASQSGAYGIAALDQAARRGLGLSSFVSMGDKADLSGNDFLRYWEQDDRTDVVLLYLESLGNPRRFAQIARRLTAAKPVIAVKSGRTLAGRRAASSHTGALLEFSEANLDALFEHAGVIRVETLDEQLDVAALLALAPLPRGERVAIVTNGGGPAIACADACGAAGLRVEPLAEQTCAKLAARLPPAAAMRNPVDMLAAATAADFRRTIEHVAADPGVDAVIAIFIPPLPGRRPEPVLRAIRAAARRAARDGVAVAAVLMGSGPSDVAGTPGVPVYSTPEHAARALGHAMRHARHLQTVVPVPRPPADVDVDAAAAVIAEALGDGAGWLHPDVAARLLRAYGLPLASFAVAATASDAARCASALGGPVALKAIVPGLLHRSEAGAVRLKLDGAAQVFRAAGEIEVALAAAGSRVDGFVVQQMAPEGVEMLVGVVGDERFGPIVARAAGGTAVELLGDVQVRLAPVAGVEAAAMLRGLRTFPLLDGYRGAPRADVRALEDIVVRAAALAAAHPEIAELDLNPVVASPSGALIVDARVRVERPLRRPSAAGLWTVAYADRLAGGTHRPSGDDRARRADRVRGTRV
ncbi:MAG: GNAT family N-acetyltransferase [Solirubrobacteraceae bacterium]